MVARGADDGHALAEIAPRAGEIMRVTIERTIRASCVDCTLQLASSGPAAAHARGSRHRVDVDYQTSFMYLPVERIGGAS
jgi:hypothetical protein